MYFPRLARSFRCSSLIIYNVPPDNKEKNNSWAINTSKLTEEYCNTFNPSSNLPCKTCRITTFNKHLCVCNIPLGIPVDPEVYITKAISSGARFILRNVFFAGGNVSMLFTCPSQYSFTWATCIYSVNNTLHPLSSNRYCFLSAGYI